MQQVGERRCDRRKSVQPWKRYYGESFGKNCSAMPAPVALHNLMELADAFLPPPAFGGLTQECIPVVQEAFAQDLVSDQVVTRHKDLVSG
jgi:hypothetical protein